MKSMPLCLPFKALSLDCYLIFLCTQSQANISPVGMGKDGVLQDVVSETDKSDVICFKRSVRECFSLKV